ncbi:hypothetical protein CR203_18350 [Salipaludibacillus neizhouensis]|uniref:Uncharacterized protein n=1 Tax=Salipaludibacillus neizhouensis TaxID=885475 RepID=A0A3A9K690_9BACI|nr:hypothetical protein [Salipaludibacillus neizhouensis]RKL65821.1 hypothetical protein CR203_18350 [Salipaludibacillus neizhouensis]
MLEKNIKKHKKFLETHQLFSYKTELDGSTYSFIQYFRFNKPTDALVLDYQGAVVERNLAQKVTGILLPFNSSLLNAPKLDLMRQKEDKLPNEMTEILGSVKLINGLDVEMQEEILQVYNAFSYQKEGQEKLDQIRKEMDVKIEVVKKTRVLTLKISQDMNTLENEFAKTVYKQALLMDYTTSSRETILNWIIENKESYDGSELEYLIKSQNLLKDSVNGRVLNTLKTSVEKFEKDVPPLQYTEVEARVKEFTLKRNEVEREKYSQYMQLLRN